MSDNYVRPIESQILEANNATKRTLASLRKTIESKGIDYEVIKASIQDTCSKTMEIFAPMLQHNLKVLTGNSKPLLSTPFQIYGVDVLIDDKLGAWVLEINDNPSLDIYFDTLFMQHKAHDEADVCPVDLYVKARVV